MVEETNGDTSLVTKSELWVADGSPMKVSFVYSNMFWRLQIWLKYKPFFLYRSWFISIIKPEYLGFCQTPTS